MLRLMEKHMAKDSRFAFVFATDGSTVTFAAGNEAPFVYGLDNMCAEARTEALHLGIKTALQNTCAGATKLGWTDAQCMSQMRRRAMAWVASWTTGDAVRDFHYLVRAFMEKTGKPLQEAETMLRELPAEDRKLVETKLHVRILELKLEEAQKQQAAVAVSPDRSAKTAALLALLD